MSNRKRLITIAGAVGALLAAGAANAQDTRDTAVLAALSRFRLGDPIRVALLRSPFVGTFVAVRGDTLFFGTPKQPAMAFRINAVDSVWRAGRRTAHGFIVGSAIGLAAGAPSRDGATIGATAVGGAILGAFIGSRLRAWRLVYGDPAPASPF